MNTLFDGWQMGPHLELLALFSKLPASNAASVVIRSDAENSDGSSELPGFARRHS